MLLSITDLQLSPAGLSLQPVEDSFWWPWCLHAEAQEPGDTWAVSSSTLTRQSCFPEACSTSHLWGPILGICSSSLSSYASGTALTWQSEPKGSQFLSQSLSPPPAPAVGQAVVSLLAKHCCALGACLRC